MFYSRFALDFEALRIYFECTDFTKKKKSSYSQSGGAGSRSRTVSVLFAFLYGLTVQSSTWGNFPGDIVCPLS